MFDFSPLKISLQVTLFSTVITFFLGILAAYYIIRLGKTLKGLLDGLLTLPMIMPPTVVGFFLLKIIGIHGPVGSILLRVFDTKLIFTWQAAVIASTVVSFPLMYRTARGAFENLDRNLIHSARTLGRSNMYIFWRIILPNCRSGVIAGTVLAFARGLGEFGATIMIAGNIPGVTQTISTAVYSAMSAGNDALAYKWVLVNIAISFAVMLAMNFAVTRTLTVSRTAQSPKEV